jgi:hypothetical protein
MTPEEKNKLLPLLTASKCGRQLNDADRAFVESMWKKDREGYAALSIDVLNEAAVSIGSTRRWR